MNLGKEFEFLDSALDPEIKKTLLQGLFEEKRAKRDAEQKAIEIREAREFERKKFWHNTPLMLALVGTITIFANGLATYVLAMRATTDAVTLKQLEVQLRESEKRSENERERRLSEMRQHFNLQASDAEAKRSASKEEREFAFRIVERELGQAKPQNERAQVLLFLVRAGVLSALNQEALQEMAEASLRPGGPGIPSLGASDAILVTRALISAQEALGVAADGNTDPSGSSEMRQAIREFQMGRNRRSPSQWPIEEINGELTGRTRELLPFLSPMPPIFRTPFERAFLGNNQGALGQQLTQVSPELLSLLLDVVKVTDFQVPANSPPDVIAAKMKELRDKLAELRKARRIDPDKGGVLDARLYDSLMSQ